MERSALLSASWTAIAPHYRATLVPRFRPWLEDTVSLLAAHKPPKGTVLVAGCGTGARSRRNCRHFIHSGSRRRRRRSRLTSSVHARLWPSGEEMVLLAQRLP